MKKLSFVFSICLVAIFFCLVPVKAFAVVVEDINGLRHYWTGYEEVPGNDNFHLRLGYVYYPQNSVSARKIDIKHSCPHHYSNHHVCANCGHVCSHADISYIEAKLPSCTEAGNIAYWECPSCKGLFSDHAAENELLSESVIIEPLGHDYELGVCTHCREGDGINGFNGSCGDTAFYWINSAGEIHIYGSGEMSDYTSGSSTPWSSHASNIKTVILEGDIERIGNYAFAECYNLTSITIPQSVTSIGKAAFANCSLLKDVFYNGKPAGWVTIDIDENNDILATKLVHYVHSISINCGFSGGNVTTSVNGEVVTEATDGMFVTLTITPEAGYELEMLSVKQGETEIVVENNSFTMPANDVSVTAIFHVSGTWGRINWTLNSNGLLKIFGKGNMVGLSESLQDAWRAYSSSIKIVEVEDGITGIGNYAFYACNEITDIFITSNVSSIGSYAFSDCSALKSISIPPTLTSISSGVFQNCSSLKSVSIPDNVTSIESNAFSGCCEMSNILIPLSLKFVKNSAFQNCSSLIDVYYGGTMDQWNEIVVEDANDFLTCADIHCITTPDLILPTELKIIENEAFTGGAFSFVKLSEQTASIGWHAFADCPNLAFIYIPAMTTHIDSQAFGEIQGLTVLGKANTVAQTYAQDHNFTFIVVS